jgi:hypothetical protein
LWISEYKEEKAKQNNINKEEQEYEYIIIKGKEYIYIDSNVYTIKDNKPNKLYGIITPENKFKMVKK